MSTELAPGVLVAGFRIESLVGHGAMAEVYRARDEQHDRVVALKVLDKPLEQDERFRRRFLRESQIAAGLDHPHIVPTLTSGDDDGLLYLAMEYIEGSDLRQLLQRDGRLDPERAVGLVEQAADALDAAHAAGLVHRDVKPGNILVRADGGGEHVYVCDFGLARHASSASSLTGDRGFVGTIDYVPPEQIEGGKIDARADVYSLGCVLYECLAGVRPFDRDSELSVVFAHLNEPPPRVTDVRPELPAAFDEVFATALAKAPDDRYSSCGELAAAARAALLGEVLTRRRPRRRLVLALSAAILTAAVAATAVFLVTRSGSVTHPTTITQTSLAGAKLGESVVPLERRWGGGQKLTVQFPADYAILRQTLLDLSAFFVGTTDKAVELVTWNKADRTAEGIGPCSSLAALKHAYGTRLKLTPNNHGYGYTVGKHLFFAIGTPPRPRFVSAVALYSNPLSTAGTIAIGEGPCTGVAPGGVNTLATTTTGAAAAPLPLTKTFTAQKFRPRITIRAPAGWKVSIDNGHAFALASPAPSQVGDQIAMFLDPYASSGSGSKHPGGTRLVGVSRTPTGLVSWFQKNPLLVVTPPNTVRIGKPVLTARTIDVDLSSKATKEDPNCPKACISYLAFKGPGYAFPYGTFIREPARLYFAEIRIGSWTHTLAITFNSASKQTFRQLLPTVTAMIAGLKIDAVPVVELSPLSTQCSPVFGGTCLGELTAGTHSSATFQPKLTYTVPLDWTNFQDQSVIFGLVPLGGDWQAVDAEKSDAVIVIDHVTAPRGPCLGGHSAISTPAAYVRSLVHNPALSVTPPRSVNLGGLSGFVVDLRIRKTWTKACPFSHGQPFVQTITDLAPRLRELSHGLIPQPMVMRLYLLGYRGGTIGIEVDALTDPSSLDAYTKVVQSFRFAHAG
jgi:tRNA A-37 threonylcarbamoyl transferase component Bud32